MNPPEFPAVPVTRRTPLKLTHNPKTRVPTRIITTSPSNFRDLVQRLTGIGDLSSADDDMSLESMRIRDYMSLLWSYNPLAFKNLDQELIPNQIKISFLHKGYTPFFNLDFLPQAILNLASDLSVHHLIQTLHHHHAHDIKYIMLSTRSDVEKQAVKQKLEAALGDNLEFSNAFCGILRVDASRYQNQVENQVLQHVHQLLHLPIIQDDSILSTRHIQSVMSTKSYLVLLVDRDGEEMLDPCKVGFSKTHLSGVVVFITTESSTLGRDKFIMKMDLVIRTEDHLLPWHLFCYNVGTEAMGSSSDIQTIAVNIVEECRGHLLAIVFVAKWLKNVYDIKLWELAMLKINSTNPSYDIHDFHGSRVMFNTFLNFIWHGLSKTQKLCLARCLFIPDIKDMKDNHELMHDWISSLFIDAKEAENNMTKFIDHSVFLQVKVNGDNKYIRLPEETYEILQSLHNLNPILVKKSGLGLTEVTESSNDELWYSALQIELADNKLSTLPLYPNWPDLTVLLLQGNVDLTKISPLFFDSVPLLRILDLSYTSVRELPISFYNLKQLRELYLKGCECFMKLPPDIGRLQKLEKLDLEETQIIHLPIEFKELTSMQSLTLCFYEYRGKKNKPYSFSTIIPSGVISKLKVLRHLSIDVNPDDERWHENVQVILPEILGILCLQTLSIYVPQLELLKLIPIHILEVDFRFIVGSHMQRILSGIPPALDVKFKQSERSLKFIKGMNVPSEIKMLLKHSKALFLDRHMTIKNLCEFEMMNLEQLRMCILAECKEMQTIVDGRHSNGKNDMLSHLLFLSVYHMKKLTSIWEGPPPHRCFLGMLQSLSLQSCPRLMTLFSLEFLGNLSMLKELVVKDCPRLSTLISHELSQLKVDVFLPKLRKLLLVYLPELTSISSRLYIGPSLKEIGIYGCPKLCSLSRKESSSQELTVIKGEFKWWKALDPQSKFNSVFSPINEEADIMTQLSIYYNDDIDAPGTTGGSVGETSSKPIAFASPMLKSSTLSDIGSRVPKQNFFRQNPRIYHSFTATDSSLSGDIEVVGSMTKSVMSKDDLFLYEHPQGASNNKEALAAGYASADSVSHHNSGSHSDREHKRGVPWTEEEHNLFLLGLQQLGKGDWRGISRNYVTTRTPIQVASHAQKYSIRHSNHNRRHLRSSLFNSNTDTVPMEEEQIQNVDSVSHSQSMYPAAIRSGVVAVQDGNPMEELWDKASNTMCESSSSKS